MHFHLLGQPPQLDRDDDCDHRLYNVCKYHLVLVVGVVGPLRLRPEQIQKEHQRKTRLAFDVERIVLGTMLRVFLDDSD